MLPGVAELQMLFAQFNNLYFDGKIPAHEIAYNARFSNMAGRITYKPPKIELSPKHLAGKPDELRETLLHEMIHAWLFALGRNPTHSAAFKRKMRELGLSSIYHDLGKAAPLYESPKRFILRCEHCRREALRRRKPPPNFRCAVCRRAVVVFEVVEMRALDQGLARASRPAAAPGRVGAERGRNSKGTLST
ncbi:MAG: SprT-like domain-containing protein [Candidatus Eremiobacteraeota bacterium]|nr:SprT-like domain-containing protein [Candidatus Eremiobacteraeota bacterium]